MSQVMLARKDERQLDDQLMAGMFRLRHDVFHDRLKWQVASDDGMEHDRFDECKPVYVLVRGDAGEVEGCWRILPTTGPYMLKDVFPELLYGASAPEHPAAWELSRFAVANGARREGRHGFTDIPIRMMQRAFQFARDNGIERYVTVTTVAIERMLRRLGIETHRYGPPMQIGCEMTVAFWIEIDANTEAAVFGTRP